MKKAKKQIKSYVGTTMMASGGAIALGAIGGTSATHGQQGIANMTRFMPTMGTMVGTGMLMRSIKKMEPKKKKYKKNKY